MRRATYAATNEGGSVIVIALMVLAIMSIIGISASRTSTTESFIVRSVGIFKQNTHMLDSTLAEAMEEIIALTYRNAEQLQTGATTLNWVHDKTAWEGMGGLNADWYDPDFAGIVLTSANSIAPRTITNDDGTGIDALLNIRGEWDGNPDNAPVRYAMIGWDPAPGSSLMGTRRTGRIVAEYVSDRYGLLRLEAGIELDLMEE